MTRPPFTLAGAILGARLAIPLLPGVIVFGSAFGTAASQKGLTLWETLAFSAFVFAGASQMVALEIWTDVWTLAGLVALVVVTTTVNARMILMGAAIQPWMAGMSPAQVAGSTFLLTDSNWLIGSRYRSEGGSDRAVLFGSGLALWVSWVAATAPGHLAGSFIANPEAYGLDLVMVMFFAAMIVPMWKGPRPAIPWLVAGAAALTAQQLLGGYSFIIIGALAGALSGAFIDDDV
ncbi:MAG: AzlC family ABC transporter permease [Microvirga sp.]|nr:AzlC family ABC transporter permease [Microvirga sp.]